MEKKKVLVIASVASMIQQFNIPNIKLLQSLGYDVDVATNFENPGTISVDKSKKLIESLDGMGVDCYQIDFNRNVFNLKSVVCAYKQLKKVFSNKAVPLNVKHNNLEKYAFTHCHSPIGGVIGRLVAKKYKVRSIYTAHGFHFYKGAPLKNWLIYYPIEKFFSRFTDTLITINKEDYGRAKKFKANKVYYIPGVGIDLEKFNVGKIDKVKKREEIGVKSDAFMLLSVGELVPNKNHEVVIRAMSILKKQNKLGSIEYVICGRGKYEKDLKKLAQELNVIDRVHFLGYRSDIYEICNSADLFVFMSHREGLPVALMEAMACGLPVICSNIRGNTDLIEDGVTGLISCNNSEKLANNIKTIQEDSLFRKELSNAVLNKIQVFDLKNVVEEMRKIYLDKC